MTQIKSTVGLIGLNYGTIGSAMMKNESDLKATISQIKHRNISGLRNRRDIMKKLKARETRRQQAHPKAGATYSPRLLYRSLTVPYSNKPGKSRIHPKQTGR